MVLSPEVRTKSKDAMNSEELENFLVAKKLFDFYDDLPIIKEFTAEEFTELYDQPIRSLIVQVLAVGVEDFYPGTDNKQLRKAMSGMEILEEINKLVKTKNEYPYKTIDEVKKSNLFFHLRKMEESGILQDVGVIKSGKRRTTYYSRVAKVFISTKMKDEAEFKLQQSNHFRTLLQRLNPGVEEDKIDTILDQMDSIQCDCSPYYMKWIKQHEIAFKGIHIDFVELFKLFNLIQQMNADNIKVIDNLANLLDIDVEKMK